VEAPETPVGMPAELEGAAAPDQPEPTDSRTAPAIEASGQGRQEVEHAEGAPVLADNSLTGTVLDPEGNPVPGATLSIARSTGPQQFAILRQVMGDSTEPVAYRKTESDADGVYTFKVMEPATDYTIIASHEDFMRVEVPFVEVGMAGEYRRDVQVERGFLLLGYVYDAGGQPVADATLELLPTFLAQIPGVRDKRDQYDFKQVVSEEDGSFRIENVTGGPKVLRCEALGYGTESVPNLQFAGPKDTPVTRDFRLKPARNIAGRVVSPALTGVKGATVEALHYKTGQRSGGGSSTNANGEFEIPNLAEGNYMILVHAEGFSDFRQNRIEAGTPDLLIELVEQATVAGRVVDDSTGTPLIGFSVALRQVNKNANYYGRAIKNVQFPEVEDGAFSLGGVEPGEYVVQVRAMDFAPTYSPPFTVTQGIPKQDIVVRMTRGGTLSGRLINQKTGGPVTGAMVTTQDNAYVENPLSALLGAMVPRTTTAKKVRTDSEGRFEINLVTPESYQLVVEHANFTREILKDLRVEEGQVTEVPPIYMTAGSVVRGTVYGVDGQPVSGASINMRGVSGGLALTYQSTADATGRYVIRRIRGGDYVINATSSPAQLSGDPFGAILEIKKSERNISVSETGETTVDLNLGG
jgi:protocatechuate 3,4-dioxygenase beta subunit